jgi:hypothetical protein
MVATVTRQRALSFFRSLADANRLRLVGLLAGPETTVDELAIALDLKPITVRKHVLQLKSLGVVAAQGDGDAARYRIDLDCVRLFCRQLAEPEPVPTLGDGIETEPWERDVLRNFFVGERLKGIPMTHKRRQPVLKWLATRFDPAKRYPEAEVNALLQNHHPDCASLRRYLVDDGYLRREHGIYWRSES